MCEIKDKEIELGGGQWLTARRRNFSLFVILLPVFVPFLLGVPAYVLFNLGLMSADSGKGIRTNYPREYKLISPNYESWKAKEAVIVPVKGDPNAFDVEFNRLVDYRARFIWLTACLSVLIVAIATSGISAWIIWCSLRDKRVISVASILVTYLILRICAGFQFYAELGNDFPNNLSPFDLNALDKFGLHLFFDPLHALDSEFQRLAWVMHVCYLVLIGLVTTILVTAAATTLASPPKREPWTVTFLAEQKQRGEIFLYTASIAMTVTILYTAACDRWPVEVIPKGRLHDDLAAYTTVAVAAQGVLSSILLLSSYFPMTLIQNAQARKFAESFLGGQKQEESVHNGREEIQKFLETHHLLTPIHSNIQRISAMLMPALASHLFTFFATL
jgi:hypothetical protein